MLLPINVVVVVTNVHVTLVTAVKIVTVIHVEVNAKLVNVNQAVNQPVNQPVVSR